MGTLQCRIGLATLAVLLGSCSSGPHTESQSPVTPAGASTLRSESPLVQSLTTPAKTSKRSATSPRPVVSKSSPKPSSKPAPSPTCSASVKYPHASGGTQTVYVSSNQPNRSVTLTIHYKSKDSSYGGQTSTSGSATVSFGVGRPTKGYTVTVDVNAGSASCSTSWTPQ
jgi:hypothetical protein